jgi:hypothetical protein
VTVQIFADHFTVCAEYSLLQTNKIRVEPSSVHNVFASPLKSVGIWAGLVPKAGRWKRLILQQFALRISCGTRFREEKSCAVEQLKLAGRIT